MDPVTTLSKQGFLRKIFGNTIQDGFVMESAAYILVLALGIGVLFFAIAFREPPRIGK